MGRELKSRPRHHGYHDSKGRQGWHLVKTTDTHEEWSVFENGKCMETCILKIAGIKNS